jgi:hypothetical protein
MNKENKVAPTSSLVSLNGGISPPSAGRERRETTNKSYWSHAAGKVTNTCCSHCHCPPVSDESATTKVILFQTKSFRGNSPVLHYNQHNVLSIDFKA